MSVLLNESGAISVLQRGKKERSDPALPLKVAASPERGQSTVSSIYPRIRKAVFPVAGMGTRFLPATKAIPKEMLPIVDKPLIQYAVEEAIGAGIEEFIFVTGRSKTAIEDHFDLAHEVESKLKENGKKAQISVVNGWVPKPGQIAYTRQPAPKGLGHAVWCARNLVGGEPFAILLADDFILAKEPCLKQMARVHAEKGGNVVAIMEVPRAQTSRYGVIDPGGDDGKLVSVKGVVEKPDPSVAPSNFTIVGRYILQPEIFDLLENQKLGAGNEVQLTDAFTALIASGEPFHGLRFEGKRFDCGEKGGFLEANIAVALSRADTADTMREILRTYC